MTPQMLTPKDPALAIEIQHLWDAIRKLQSQGTGGAGADGATGATGAAGADGDPAVAAGAAGNVQYNDGSDGFAAEAAFTYDVATNTLTVDNVVGTGAGTLQLGTAALPIVHAYFDTTTLAVGGEIYCTPGSDRFFFKRGGFIFEMWNDGCMSNKPMFVWADNTDAVNLLAGGKLAWDNTGAYGVNDTNLYRGAANVLKTDDQFIAVLGVNTKRAVTDVAATPTDANLDTAFGQPATLGAGFVGVLDDNDAGTAVYLCFTTGTAGEWFYVAGTKAL